MESEERLKSILEEVANYFNFKSWTYSQKNLNETIENYFGVLKPVTITGIGNNGEEDRSVFVKIPPADRPDQIKTVLRQHYEVEIYTYTTLLPIYQGITNVEMKQFIPECYHASLEENNEVLVLQDMTCSGYRRHKGEMLDLEHVVVSLKALAKFHCLSIVFKEKGFDFDADVMKPYTHLHPEPYYTYIKHSLESRTGVFGDGEHQVYLKTLSENLATYIGNSSSEVSYLVYGHGDFWRENILFKYKNDKPIGACLLDFQKSRKMSPAQDVLLFILGNIENTLRRKHHQYFLDVYLEELHRILEENGLHQIYSMENLVRDMSVVAPYSIAITTMAYSLWLGLEDGDIVKSKNTCNNERRKLTLLRFKTTIVDMLEYLVHFGYITLR